MGSQTIAIIGGLDADLIMITNRFPNPGESVMANEYLESLGGKGANSAISTYRACNKKPSEREEVTVSREPKEPTESENAVATTNERPRLAPSEAATGYKDKNNIQVKMIGAVGDDRYGEQSITELTKNGIDTSSVVTVPNTPSSICFVLVDYFTRENSCLFTLGGTASWKKENFIKVEDLGGGMRPDLVVAQMEIHKEVVETMIETAGKAGVDFCLNAAPATPIAERMYRHITHLLVNESEAAIMSGRDRDEVNEETWSVIAEEFLTLGVKNVIITLGAKGAFYATATERGHSLAYNVNVVDTTGAGDTFIGAYASDYIRQRAKGSWDIRSAVIRANKAAAIAIQSFGAQDGIPWADEIDNFDALEKAFDGACML